MALKGRPPAGYEDWMLPVAEFMQYENMTFSLSARAAGKAFTSSEQERQVEHSDAFISVLRAVRKERHTRLLEELTKEGMEAELWDVVKELRREKQSDKVYGPASLVIKMRGWIPEAVTEQPVLANLTEKDLKALEEQAAAKLKAQNAEKAEKAEKEQTVKVVLVDGNPN